MFINQNHNLQNIDFQCSRGNLTGIWLQLKRTGSHTEFLNKETCWSVIITKRSGLLSDLKTEGGGGSENAHPYCIGFYHSYRCQNCWVMSFLHKNLKIFQLLFLIIYLECSEVGTIVSSHLICYQKSVADLMKNHVKTQDRHKIMFWSL